MILLGFVERSRVVCLMVERLEVRIPLQACILLCLWTRYYMGIQSNAVLIDTLCSIGMSVQQPEASEAAEVTKRTSAPQPFDSQCTGDSFTRDFCCLMTRPTSTAVILQPDWLAGWQAQRRWALQIPKYVSVRGGCFSMGISISWVVCMVFSLHTCIMRSPRQLISHSPCSFFLFSFFS